MMRRLVGSNQRMLLAVQLFDRVNLISFGPGTGEAGLAFNMAIFDRDVMPLVE